MSQFAYNPFTDNLDYKSLAGGGLGGIIAIVGDSGGPVMSDGAGNINLIGGTSTANNTKGIQVAGNAGAFSETVTLTNRQVGAVTTADATPTTLISFTCGVVATVYQFECRIAAFDATDVAGGSYLLVGGVRTDGVTATLIPNVDINVSEEAAMIASNIDLIVTGNTAVIQVTGIAAKTIRWQGILTYVQVV